MFERRQVSLVGHLRAGSVVSGVRRGRLGLYQRRVRPRVFGEPIFERELVEAAIEPTRPHVLAYIAWKRLREAALADGISAEDLEIHSAYRSVALQDQVWRYRLEERRRLRAEAGEPPLSERELERLQMKWTAKPGQSAHHTGLALDLGLYRLGKRDARRSPTYLWLASNARLFGFYPYLPEGWHWEFNPPGLVSQLASLRACLSRGEDPGPLLELPDPIPLAPPRGGRPPR